VSATSDSISAAHLRHALGHFATGVTVVTSVSDRGEPAGTTASAVSAVSLDPPLVLVCLDRGSHTLAAIRASGRFVINVLAEDQRPLSDNFARSGATANWSGVDHRPGSDGSPLLDGALARLRCTLEQRLEGGDHEIVVGRVNELDVDPDRGGPLLHYQGTYASLGSP
jgi:3-hydroxy-9,10-secoandrosta-1,3,5(10)-triene-9,17-dione monooxygenase reductase component